MDEEYAGLILGQPIQLPAHASEIHWLFVSYGSSSSTAKGELLSRSDALGSCSLQASTLTFL